MICEVCNGEYGSLTLNLGKHPLCDDLTPIDSNQVAEKFQQLISLCENCLTAHQVIPVTKELLFKPSYHYRASLTRDVIDGMKTLVKDIVNQFPKNDEIYRVLDIGCNDGSLLGIFKEEIHCVTIGVDPTAAILESGNRIDFKFNEYFTNATARAIIEEHPKIHLITFTNVFAHIEDLPTLLANLKLLISEDTTLVIENHYLGSILTRNQFDTFYHEHPRTYSLNSFQFIAASLGLLITQVAFPARYGGNIRITMKKSGRKADVHEYLAKEATFIESFSALQEIYDHWKLDASKSLAELSAKGQIYGKALPGRAVMLINALNLDDSKMPIIFEQAKSPKVGNYVPSTKIKILSDEELLGYNPGVLIVWSWHIINEIVEYLDALGYRGEIWVPLPEFKMFRPAI